MRALGHFLVNEYRCKNLAPRNIFPLFFLLACFTTSAHAQAFADLRTAFLPAAIEPSPPAGHFSFNRPFCVDALATQGFSVQDSDVLNRISAQLASTALFVERYPASSTLVAERNARSFDSCAFDAASPKIPVRDPSGNNFVTAASLRAAVASAANPLSPQELFPDIFCRPSTALTISPLCAAPAGATYFRSWDLLRSPSIQPAGYVRSKRADDSFRWRPALWQSVEFLLFEHAFRLLDDHYLRYLLWHKPFWHDYAVSAGQFDMSRWGDGDNFLVNYIGHPMQGGVTGNIYIQNDPRGRALKFGNSKAYWQSRMKAMLWSAVYSAYFEIGPVLSEVAIGNEGGYTYTPGCGHIVCDRPGHKPPTNNTGWVDFIVTPTIGTGWIFLEDSIEAKFVDRVAKNDPRFRFKVLRSVLAPSHSMANMLAGRYPWFRYSEDSLTPSSAFGPDLQIQKPLWKYDYRWNAGFHYANLNLPMDSPGCAACRVRNSGAGINLGYRLTNLLSFDSEANFFPGSSGANGRGRVTELLTGVKLGRTLHSWGAFTTLRTGFIHYEKTLVPGSATDYESANRFAIDLGGAVEYYASRRSTIRFDAGTTLVRYLTGHPDPRQLPQTVLSADYIVTQGNFHLGSGYVFRF